MTRFPLNERGNNSRAYLLLEQDYKKVFEYIEPVTANENVYSHRLFELYLRACTEFENLSRQCFLNNGKTQTEVDGYNINQYFNLIKDFDLDQYCLFSPIFVNLGVNIAPFSVMGSYKNYQAYYDDMVLKKQRNWYQEYNEVKHNRNANFTKANLENVTMAVAAVAVLLLSQYGLSAFDPYHNTPMYHSAENDMVFVQDTIWTVKAPESMPDI